MIKNLLNSWYKFMWPQWVVQGVRTLSINIKYDIMTIKRHKPQGMHNLQLAGCYRVLTSGN